jgi:ribosomal-protein-alanine N-acetyltransferase
MASAAKIRRAEAADRQRLVAVEALCRELTAWPEASWDAVFSSDEGGLMRRAAWLAEDDEAAAGFVVVALIGDVAEVEALGVVPARRRQRIARALVVAGFEWAGREGAARMRLEVRESNAAAIALYASLGFEQQGVRRGYYREPDEDAVLMSLALNA